MQAHGEPRETKRSSLEALRQAVIALNEGDMSAAASYAELAAILAEAKSDRALYGNLAGV